MYRGYCAHSSLVGVCSSGVCLIIRTAITNAWQNCPLCTGGDRRCRLQCVRADAPRSPFVSAVPLSVQGLQGSMELSASNTPVGKSSILSVSQQRSADASAPPRRGAYTPTLRAQSSASGSARPPMLRWRPRSLRCTAWTLRRWACSALGASGATAGGRRGSCCMHRRDCAAVTTLCRPIHTQQLLGHRRLQVTCNPDSGRGPCAGATRLMK